MVAAALGPGPPPLAGAGRASDGDSFRLGEDRVRLLGLDAPELAQTCTDEAGRQWPCGRAARDRLATLLAAGPVDCVPEDKDQYGRLLAHCIVAGRDLGAAIVADGLAVSSGRYWTEEARAREQRLGIWQGDFDAPKAWRQDHPRPQGFLGWLGL